MIEFIESDREWLEYTAKSEAFSHQLYLEDGINKLDGSETTILFNTTDSIINYAHNDAFIIDGWTFPTTWFTEMGGAADGHFFSERLLGDVNESIGVMFSRNEGKLSYQLFTKIVDTGCNFNYAIEFIGNKRLYRTHNFHKWDDAVIQKIVAFVDDNKDQTVF